MMRPSLHRTRFPLPAPPRVAAKARFAPETAGCAIPPCPQAAPSVIATSSPCSPRAQDATRPDETRDKQREAVAGGSRETNAGGRGRNPGGDGGIEGTGSGHGRCSDDSLDQAAKLLQERRSVAPCRLKMVKLSAPEPAPGGGRGRYSLRSMSTQMPWVEEKTTATPMCFMLKSMLLPIPFVAIQEGMLWRRHSRP